MPVLLRIIDGPQAGASLEVREGGRAILGRSDRCDFRILDSWASRIHCAVACRADGVFLEDLNTKNGTYVNGKRVEKARLPDGSLVQLGTTTVQVLVQPTRRTVVARVAVPFRRRAVRLAAGLGAAAVLLVGMAFGALLFLGPRGPARSEDAEGVAWDRAKDRDTGFGLFGLLPGRASVQVTSEPVGASVFIDDEFRGATPLQNLEVAAGEHVLRIQKAGYEVHRARLSVRGGQAQPIHVVLRPAARGILLVNSHPDGASVHLDGEYRGNTPLRLEDLEPRTYSVRVSKANFADWHGDVAVASNETTTVEAALGHREVAYYEAELKKDPDNVSYHTEVAHLYLLERKPDQCIAHLTDAIEITIAGRDSTRGGAYATRLLQLIAKMYFNDHFTYGDASVVKQIQGRIDQMLARVAARHPDSSFLSSAVRHLYKRAGSSLRAKAEQYEAKAKANPGQLDHTLAAVGFLVLAKEHSRAETLLQAACKASPNDPRPYMAMGRFYIGARKRGVRNARQKAIQALNAALQRCKDEATKAEVRRLLGRASG